MKKIRLFLTILFAISFVFLCTLVSHAAGWVDDGGGNWSYVEREGFYVTETIKASGNDKYYLDEFGIMVRDYLLENYNDAIYYFDDTGKMVTNTWVAVEPSQVYNPMDNPPTIYLYYFGANGKAYKSRQGVKRYTIDGKKYLFNENGQMLSGWINEEGERWDEYQSEDDPFDGFCYYAGDETDGVLREGWTSYEDGSVQDKYYMKLTLWFYFKSTDNKKIQAENENELKTKVINGRTYAFDDKGVMAVGWDSDLLDVNNEDSSIRSKKYYVEEEGDDMGRNTKREWFFAVPSMKQNLDDHDQEIERWFYAQGSGEVLKGIMKKVNKDYYVFNKEGIMKSGLCVINKQTREYVDSIDAERTDGKDFIISRHYISTDKTSNAKEFEIFDDKEQILFFFRDDEVEDKANFGKRKLGESDVAFGDDDYKFVSRSSGEYEGLKSKRYYQAGMLLQPDPTINMGVVLVGYSKSTTGETIDEPLQYNNSTNAWANPDTNHNNILSDYIVSEDFEKLYNDYGVVPAFMAVNPKGTRFNRSNRVKKDKNGRYWLIGQDGMLINVYEVPIRYNRQEGWQFKSESSLNAKAKVRTQWIKFGTKDEYDKTCKYSKIDPGDYALRLDDTYCLNFRFTD